MKINTNNYEEFFLLYIDNELTASQKAAVDLFIHENPEYKKEFALLQQTVLSPEPISYEDKAFLYRFEEMEASLSNNFKHSLYRKEATIVKGFFTNPSARAVSAIAALFLLVIGFQLFNQKTSFPNNSKQALASHKSEPSNVSVNSGEDKEETIDNNIFTERSIQHKEEAVINTSANSSTNPKTITNTNALTSTNSSLVANELEPSVLKSIPYNEIQKSELNMDAIGNAPNNSIEKAANQETINSERKETFETINTDNPDREIYIANFEIDGEKWRGLTRKVSALFRKNKTDK